MPELIMAAEQKPDYAIVIHGGAGSAPTDQEFIESRERVLEQALSTGTAILDKGGTSLDAVEQVIRILEDSPLFNAGRGGVLTAKGHNELDATIMNGETRACGAVGGVTTVKNPISLARRVMTETRHVLLAAEGADRANLRRSQGPEHWLQGGRRRLAQPGLRAPLLELTPKGHHEPLF